MVDPLKTEENNSPILIVDEEIPEDAHANS